MLIHAPNTLHAPELARYFHRVLSGFVELAPLPAWPVDREDEQLGLFSV